MMTKRVKEILSHYPGENAGVLTNLARLMMHGRLAGTGKFVILPDKGFDKTFLFRFELGRLVPTEQGSIASRAGDDRPSTSE